MSDNAFQQYSDEGQSNDENQQKQEPVHQNSIKIDGLEEKNGEIPFEEVSLSMRGSQPYRSGPRHSIFNSSFHNESVKSQNIHIAGLDDSPKSNRNRESGQPTDQSSNVDNQNQDDLNEVLNTSIANPGAHGDFGRASVGVVQTYFNTFKCFIGIGILAIPEAFSKVGILGGVVGIIIIGVLNTYTIILTCQCKFKIEDEDEIGPDGAPNKQPIVVGSYSQLSLMSLGHKGKSFVDCCLAGSQVGFCIAYLLFIGDQIESVVCYETMFTQCGRNEAYIVFAALVLIPICWLKSLRYLSYVNQIAIVSIFFSLVVIMVYDGESLENNPEAHQHLNVLVPSKIPYFFGVGVFNFEGNGVALNIQTAMKKQDSFPTVLKVSMGLLITLVAVFGSVSYASYGENIGDLVTENLPHNNLTSAVLLFYAIGLLGTYPLAMMPAFEVIENSSCFKNMRTSEKIPKLKSLIMRTMMVLFTALIASIIPKFGLFISLIGAFTCTALAFILPVLMYNSVFSDALTLKRKIFHWFILVFGTMCGMISFTLSSIDLINAFGNQEQTTPPVTSNP